MLQETNGPAGKGEAGVQLSGANSGLLSKNPAIQQATRTILKAENGHLIGSPRVVIDHKPASVVIHIMGAPWGWGDCRQEFLHNGTPGVGSKRYAEKLQQRIRLAAERENERRERIKVARAAEREAAR